MIKAIINGKSFEYCKDCGVYHKAMSKKRKKKGCNRKTLVRI